MGDNRTMSKMGYTPIGISDEGSVIGEIVINLCVNSLLSLMGTVTNIMTMTVFAKMGFKETANITMTAIAFWNLLRCMLMGSSCLQYAMRLGPYGFSQSYRWMTFIFGMYLSKIPYFASGALSAYIAIERCLCVCLPFTVKSILTRKSVTITCIAISTLIVGSYIIFFACVEIITYEKNNATITDFKHNSFYMDIPEIENYLRYYSQVVPIVCVGITSVCTAIIIYKLKLSSKFRSGGKQDASSDLSARDKKIVKMLVIVMGVYVVCNIPWIAAFIMQSVFPLYASGGPWANLFWTNQAIVHAFSLVDSSTNIFIFYNMSSEFHQMLRHMLFREPLKKK